MTSKTQPSDNEIWRKFVDDKKIHNSVKTGDINSPDIPFPDLSALDYKQGMLTLKGFFNAEGYKRFNDRYRQFKRRQKTALTTITIRDETLNRLQALSRKSGFNSDSYDLLFEYLMDPEDELNVFKSDPDVCDLPTALDMTEQSQLLKARLKLRGSTWRYILSQIEYSFNAGWIKCKYLQGKKRTEQVQQAALENFMDDVKGL